jgi:putative transposase
MALAARAARRRGPWRSFDDVEFATLECVAWFNTQRLLAPLGYVPRAEFEAQYHETHTAHIGSVGLN